MEQLSQLDYAMVQMDSPRTPQLISIAMLYTQPGNRKHRVGFDDVIDVFRRSLPRSAVFRRKLGGSTGGYDTPYWVEDQKFDLDQHLRHIALPKPGDWRQLCNQLARLHSQQLDMNRALWEAYMIEGLDACEVVPPGSFAIMLKLHHAAIDGVSAAEIINGLHSLSATVQKEVVEDNWQGEPDPTPLQVWPKAYWNAFKRPAKLVGALRDVLPKAIKAGRDTKKNKEDKPAGFKTLLNKPIGPGRVMDALVLDLDRVKQARKAVEGVTVNDVIIAVVGGGLRKYLAAKNALPEHSMTTSVPISLRETRDGDSRGNQVGLMSITLGTDIADPVERMRVVHQSGRDAKDYTAAIGADSMTQITQSLSPRIIGVGLKLAFKAAGSDDIPFPVHTIVSNVPGPQMPLFLAGAPLQILLGMGPLSDGMGVFHGIVSGGGRIPITVVSCREILPDPELYRECLREAWDELEVATAK